jgi:hypothetical protein
MPTVSAQAASAVANIGVDYHNTTIRLAQAEPGFGPRGGAIAGGVLGDTATTDDGGKTWHVRTISVRATRYEDTGASYAVV